MWDMLGSSPRVWGQGFGLGIDRKNSRIIPTRVGTREQNREQEKQEWDHPHACGDKL